MSEAYSTRRICERLEIPIATLNYWMRHGLVTPSIRASQGKRGRGGLWSRSDVAAILAIQALRTAGVADETIRSVSFLIKDTEHGFLVVSDSSVMIYRDDDALKSLSRRPFGSVLYVFSLPALFSKAANALAT